MLSSLSPFLGWKEEVWLLCLLNYLNAVCAVTNQPDPALVGFHFDMELCDISASAAGLLASPDAAKQQVTNASPGCWFCAVGGWQGWGWLLASGLRSVGLVPLLLSVLDSTAGRRSGFGQQEG